MPLLVLRVYELIVRLCSPATTQDVAVLSLIHFIPCMLQRLDRESSSCVHPFEVNAEHILESLNSLQHIVIGVHPGDQRVAVLSCPRLAKTYVCVKFRHKHRSN